MTPLLATTASDRLVERPGMELGARLASRVRRPSREVVVV
ncbi:hypothetical protein J2792_001961 [Novosphingobium capsulatum]|uniref:Uncharacterized protein n=1 Tax=Novosphingobium capsulatum TaxID=13688 RepID=A0ABU1ML71_9SPHN|nr:hypothetical protein [Novosphingobium capsulatum]